VIRCPVLLGRLVLALCACFPFHALAEATRLTADDAVERALSRDQGQLVGQTRIEVARSELTRARTLSNPSLSGSREDLVEPGLASGDETTLMLTQPFELGGRRGSTIRAAEAGVAVAEAEARKDQRQIRAETLLAYYRTVAADQVLQAKADAESGLTRLADLAAKRQSEGDLSGYEARRIRQAAEQASVARANAEADAHAARTALMAWTGPLAASALLDEALPVPELPQASPGASLELDVLAAQKARAEAALQAATRLGVPIELGVGRRRTRIGDFSDEALMLEVSIELPVFNRQQGERRSARAELSLAEIQWQREQKLLPLRRASLRAQAEARIAAAERIATTLLPEARALTSIATSSFAEGELDVVALIDAIDHETALVEQVGVERLHALEAALALDLLQPRNP